MNKEIKTYKGFLRFYERVMKEKQKQIGGTVLKMPEDYKEIAKGIVESKQARKLFMKYNKSHESYLYSLIREYLKRR